jgi:hypothetical protein
MLRRLSLHEGMLRHLKLPALYTPDSDQRNLSTGCLLDKYDPERNDVTSRKWVLGGVEMMQLELQLKSEYVHKTTFIPSSISYQYDGINSSFCGGTESWSTHFSRSFSMRNARTKVLWIQQTERHQSG